MEGKQLFLARYRESHCLGCFELWADLDTEIGGTSDRLNRRNVKGEAYTIVLSSRTLMRLSTTRYNNISIDVKERQFERSKIGED